MSGQMSAPYTDVPSERVLGTPITSFKVELATPIVDYVLIAERSNCAVDLYEEASDKARRVEIPSDASVKRVKVSLDHSNPNCATITFY